MRSTIRWPWDRLWPSTWAANRLPDETTVCKFRHLLEQHGLAARIFAEVDAYLAAQGLKISAGAIVDATILHAPCSTKNKTGRRDPEMHQLRKGESVVLRHEGPYRGG